MIHGLCWNRVRDFDRRKKVFSSHREAHLAAGVIERDDHLPSDGGSCST